MTPTLGMTTAATQNAARLSAGTLNGAFRRWRSRSTAAAATIAVPRSAGRVTAGPNGPS